jgi:hypothetical protein
MGAAIPASRLQGVEAMSENNRHEIILTVRNSHDAIAAEQALLEARVPVRVMPLSTQIGMGCGICLRADPSQRHAVSEALARAGIDTVSLYLCGNVDGRLVYTKIDEEGLEQ